MLTEDHWLTEVLKDVRGAADKAGYRNTSDLIQTAITALALEIRGYQVDPESLKGAMPRGRIKLQ